jgi:hypothetical protein
MEFPGTTAEKAFNYTTHKFDPIFERCIDCDCRPWGRVASWQCGTQFIPRVQVL